MGTEQNTEIKNNAESLHINVKYTGFPIDIDHLKREMATLKPEFTIEITKKIGGKLHEGKEMVYILPFTKSETENNYFLNSFQATLKRPGLDDLSNGFYTDSKITARESFNLLEGRSAEKKYNRREELEVDGKKVYKPIKDDTYLAWRKIDFTDKDAKGNYKLLSYGEGYGFDLEEQLSKVPLKHRPDENDIKDLKKGELLAVTFEKEGASLKGYLEANPRGWNLTTRDADLTLIKDMNKHLGQQKANTLAAESQTQGKANKISDESTGKSVTVDQSTNQGKANKIGDKSTEQTVSANQSANRGKSQEQKHAEKNSQTTAKTTQKKSGSKKKSAGIRH